MGDGHDDWAGHSLGALPAYPVLMGICDEKKKDRCVPLPKLRTDNPQMRDPLLNNRELLLSVGKSTGNQQAAIRQCFLDHLARDDGLPLKIPGHDSVHLNDHPGFVPAQPDAVLLGQNFQNGFIGRGGLSSRHPRISHTSSRESIRDSFPYALGEEFPEKAGKSLFSFLNLASNLGWDRLARKRIRFQVNETGHCLAFQPDLQCP